MKKATKLKARKYETADFINQIKKCIVILVLLCIKRFEQASFKLNNAYSTLGKAEK